MLLLPTLALLVVPPVLGHWSPFAVHRSPLIGHHSPLTAQTDTTIPVGPGTRLRVEIMSGQIAVRAWDQNQVRVQANHAPRTEVEIRRSGTVLSLEASGTFGLPGVVDYQLTVPSWMPLVLEGMSATISIEGTRAAIEAETIEGDITVRGGAETVKLTTINGRILVTGARGRLELESASDGIEVSDLQGDLVVDAISGDVLLRGITGKSVRVESVSGNVWFEGRIQDGGSYSISSHSGNIAIAVAEGVNATLAAESFSGSLRAGFSLPSADERTRHEQRYRFGNGSAVVQLEAFSGNIELLRPAELITRLERTMRERREREEARARARRDRKPDRDPEPDGPGDLAPGDLSQ